MAEKSEGSPGSLRASAGLWCALAAFLLVQLLFSWSDKAELRGQLLASGVAGSAVEAEEKARSLLLLNTGLAVALAATYVVLGLLLLRRLAYVRVAVTVLVILHAVVVLGAGTPSLVNLIVFALAGAALVTAWKRTSSDWLTGER